MSRTLKLDIDLPFRLFWALAGEWIATRRLILKYYGLELREWAIRRSPSGKTHVYLTVDRELSAREIAKLQFMLGDDHSRALFNFARLAFGEKVFHAFNILFADKEEVKDVHEDPVVELAIRALTEGGKSARNREV